MIFSDIYLFSDIDGTLGIENEGIPKRNTSAISRFVENGGNFSLCTGRMAVDIKHFTKDVTVNGTCIINNGGAYYDYSTGQSFGIRTLPPEAIEYLRCMLINDEFLDVTAITRAGFFRIMNFENLDLPNDEDLNRRLAKLEETKAQLLRVVFSFPAACDIKKKVSLWNSWGFSEVSFVQVSESYIEMLPRGVNKGSALIELCAMQGIPIDRTFFIGDSYNDKEIFLTAGFSACVAETPIELQGYCDCVLGPCLDGALADFIQMLEKENLRTA